MNEHDVTNFIPVIKTLSHLIREGATLAPQCYGTLFYFRAVDSGAYPFDGLSAMGAAHMAYESRKTLNPKNIPKLSRFLPGAYERGSQCPECQTNNFDGSIVYTVTHLNDDHRWTRERIADWLESIGL